MSPRVPSAEQVMAGFELALRLHAPQGPHERMQTLAPRRNRSRAPLGVFRAQDSVFLRLGVWSLRAQQRAVLERALGPEVERALQTGQLGLPLSLWVRSPDLPPGLLAPLARSRHPALTAAALAHPQTPKNAVLDVIAVCMDDLFEGQPGADPPLWAALEHPSLSGADWDALDLPPEVQDTLGQRHPARLSVDAARRLPGPVNLAVLLSPVPAPDVLAALQARTPSVVLLEPSALPLPGADDPVWPVLSRTVYPQLKAVLRHLERLRPEALEHLADPLGALLLTQHPRSRPAALEALYLSHPLARVRQLAAQHPGAPQTVRDLATLEGLL